MHILLENIPLRSSPRKPGTGSEGAFPWSLPSGPTDPRPSKNQSHSVLDKHRPLRVWHLIWDLFPMTVHFLYNPLETSQLILWFTLKGACHWGLG